jgi:zinc/manganese transport system ATP-binding protein
MSVAVFAGVALGFRGRMVLSGIDLTLRQGEFVGLLGPNGAGKTTLLRSLFGLVRPGAGQILVEGTRARPGHAAVGYLPQTRAEPLPAITGRDLLAASLHGARWGVPRLSGADRAEIDRVLADVGASDLAARPITALSGGERQRVLIAQSLLGRPRLLLLDEPLAGLDPTHQHGVVSLLRRLQQERGLTVLCSAHDLNVLLPAVDRVLYLGGGRAALGAVDEVVTDEVLSSLYGAPMRVVRAEGQVFVARVREGVLF